MKLKFGLAMVGTMLTLGMAQAAQADDRDYPLTLRLATDDLTDVRASANSGDYATELRPLKPLANQGDAQAQANLGFMYDTGRGVPVDHVEALKYYRLVANQNHPLRLATDRPEFAPLLNRTLQLQCEQRDCIFASIRKSTPVGKTKLGELYALNLSSWDFDPNRLTRKNLSQLIRKTKGYASIQYVFCSKKKPARFIANPRWQVNFLSPGQGISIADMDAYVIYYAACHKTAIDLSDDDAVLARKLGYDPKDFKDSDSENTNQTPLEALSW